RVRVNGHSVATTPGRVVFNEALPLNKEPTEVDEPALEFQNDHFDRKKLRALVSRIFRLYGNDVTAAVSNEIKKVGFRHATRAGITISALDLPAPANKAAILARAEKEVEEVERMYRRGVMTEDERYRKVIDIWSKATDEVAKATEESFDKFSPVWMMMGSGARGNIQQVRQLAGMRGLMADPTGRIIDLPIKANFTEGLTVLEYFISTHGARKGLADTALRTADSGYLTRRLVDVAQDVIIRESDCGTEEYIEMAVYKADGQPNDGLVGRVAALPIRTKRNRLLAEQGTEIGRAELGDIAQAFADDHAKGVEVKVPVRSVLKCEAASGVCQACYGRAMATGALAQIGDAGGIIAAQSIGEPGTQLTMRTFHTGGVAGADITHGLPRVVELFEARKPKGLAKIAEQDGVVSIEETDKALTVVIGDPKGEEARHAFARRTRLLVSEGQKITAGSPLNEGSVYPHELLAIRGRTETEQYLVREVQEVYKSQGVDINDKHVELIVRQM